MSRNGATGGRRCSSSPAITPCIAICSPSDARRTACPGLAIRLMPNHLHLILAPTTREGLSRAVGEAHRRYTAFVNARARQTGHLFQGRFGCVAMDEPHLLNAVRYLAFNPVRARLCVTPGEWEWSSVRAHLRRARRRAGRGAACSGDRVALRRPAGDVAVRAGRAAGFETCSGNGRPLGDEAFLAFAEAKLGRSLRKGKPGPKPRAAGSVR